MEQLMIKPNVGIYEIKLGMPRKEVHTIMGKDFFSNEIDTIKIDYYWDANFQISYDEKDIVNYIELSSHIKDSYQVLLEEIDVFNTSAKEVVAYIEKLSKYKEDEDAQLGYAYKFEDIGVSLWRSNLFHEEILQEQWFQQLTEEGKKEEMKCNYFESISVWTKGYYDNPS